MNSMNDLLILGGHEFSSRFIIGSGKISMDFTPTVIENSGAQIVTLALRRANQAGGENILEYIPKHVTLLPNTSGARTAEEAVRIARLAREIGCGDFVKIEVIRDSKYLLPDNTETIRAHRTAGKGRICCTALYVILTSMLHVTCKMPVLPPSCRLLHRLAPTKVCVPVNLFKSLWTKLTCQLL